MRSTLGPSEAAQRAAAQPRRRVDGRLVVLLVVVALYSRGMLSGSLNPVVLRTWTTVFVAIVVQALPFLVLGVLVSGAITALVSPAVLERLLPRSAPTHQLGYARRESLVLSLCGGRPAPDELRAHRA